jgi:lipopolysaccharide/colanic/teichoic acid biosynthesis glycosyltransferase
MSLVGPRPVVCEELARYGLAVQSYLDVRPGMTGLWQVEGRSGTTYQERIRLDCLYIRAWSFRWDLLILLRTIGAVIRRVGAH